MQIAERIYRAASYYGTEVDIQFFRVADGQLQKTRADWRVTFIANVLAGIDQNYSYSRANI